MVPGHLHGDRYHAGAQGEARRKKLADAVVWPLQAKIDCADCKKTWKERWHSVPDCSVCDYPGLWPENLEAYNIIIEGGRALADHQGNINLANARLVCETLGYTWDAFMMKKIIGALTAQADFYEEEIRQEVKSRQINAEN